MKYLFSFILLLFAFSLQSLQAATSIQAVASIEDALIGIDERTFDFANIIGIGRIASNARAQGPIQTLATRTQTQQGQGIRMGMRLFNFMNETLQSGVTNAINADPTLAVSTDIVDGDIDIDSVSVESGRMYPPRLQVDFQKFPIPTYTIMPDEVQQKRMAKLNSQLQKRFGETVKADFQENVHYLRGTVASERQREILEIFIKMEPGIQEVRNEVVVRE